MSQKKFVEKIILNFYLQPNELVLFQKMNYRKVMFFEQAYSAIKEMEDFENAEDC